MRFKYLLLVIGLGLILGAAAGLKLLHGPPEKPSQKDAPAPSPTDIKEVWSLKEGWSQLAGDATVWRRADVTDPHQQFIFDLVAERLQSNSGEITKEQFLSITQRPAAARPAEAAPAKPAGAAKQKADKPRAPTPNGPPPAGQPAGNDAPPPDPRAEVAFRRMDRDGDGRLSLAEMDDALKAERDKWDTNKDGFIDLDEFREYHKARMEQFRAAIRDAKRPKVGGRERPAAAEDKASPPPVAFVAVNQSADLPEEYRKYDTDHDGQIGLYEWKAAGLPVAKFRELDLNGDGFLTPDELLPPVEVANKNSPRGEAEPDPGNLTAYQDQIGKVFRFRVTGAIGGGIWGANPYTSDTSLAVAAVHAGVLKDGQTGTVRVRIVQPPPQFEGSTANGVTAPPFGQFPGAYRVMR